MFELLGLALLLAALLTFNSIASLVIAGLWRLAGRITDNWSAATRARLLFSLRTLPALLAFLFVALLLVPAYVAYEPRHTTENVGFKLGLLAFLSATGIAVSIYRGIATNRATANLTSDWLRQGKPIQIPGINIKSYEIHHQFPLIGIVGFLRPRLFIASQVLEILTPEEIAAAVAHENGHLEARDNLKRGLLQACRDVLLIIPSGRLLDKSWSEASEEAADENAALQGNGVALDLASALVKIARIIPLGARPTMPAGVFLLGDHEEAKGIKSRVRRLIALATAERGTVRHDVLARFFVWGPASLLLVAFVIGATNPYLLSRVHYLIEHVVFVLQ
ncbi:MAG TPA: M56 family metallopeptidase [Pyrinomonadaceae bacterium]|jgi:Zn-dependent protease with chaperone function|nr:M56 family metallopeptidase [Pyrinomonadaceae bacterium]